MKLIDAIKNVVRTKENEQWIDLEEFADECGVSSSASYRINEEFGDEIETRLKSYWITTWCCTDTWVGIRSVWLDDQPVGIISQSARKNGIEVEMISEQARTQVQTMLIDYQRRLASQIGRTSILSADELEEEIADLQSTHYSDSLIEKYGTVNDRACEFVRRVNNQHCDQQICVR